MAESLAGISTDTPASDRADSASRKASLTPVESVTVRVDLPSPMRRVLDDSIPGFVAWSLEHYHEGVHTSFNRLRQKLPSIVFGDFNNDGISDVVMDGTDGQRSVKVALVSTGATYRLLLLDARPLDDQSLYDSIVFLVYQAPGRVDTLACSLHGEQEQCDPAPFMLTADAFQEVFLEKAATLWYWTGDRFAQAGTSD